MILFGTKFGGASPRAPIDGSFLRSYNRMCGKSRTSNLNRRTRQCIEEELSWDLGFQLPSKWEGQIFWRNLRIFAPDSSGWGAACAISFFHGNETVERMKRIFHGNWTWRRKYELSVMLSEKTRIAFMIIEKYCAFLFVLYFPLNYSLTPIQLPALSLTNKYWIGISTFKTPFLYKALTEELRAIKIFNIKLN